MRVEQGLRRHESDGSLGAGQQGQGTDLLGEAEIANPHAQTGTVVADQYILRRDVPMDDRRGLPMGDRQATQYLPHDVHRGRDGHERVAVRRPEIVQGTAGHVFHGEVCVYSVVRLDGVRLKHADDVGVTHAGQQHRLAECVMHLFP